LRLAVIASEAKQSSFLPTIKEEKLDCFVASAFARRRASADKSAPRNDGVEAFNPRCDECDVLCDYPTGKSPKVCKAPWKKIF
jgi:hypothetical protein